MSLENPRAVINKNLLLLHFTVIIWGFTGVLGALISISAVSLVWFRVLIASTSLFLYFIFFKINFKVSWQAFFKFIFTGALVGCHWVLFFASIKLSTIAVTLVCLSSITLFTAIFDPLINKRSISKLQILVGILIITGIVLIFKFETQYTTGIIAGLISAVVASLFAIINSKLVHRNEATVIAFYELSGAFFWITVYLLFTSGFNKNMIPTHADMVYLLILGTICTSIAYAAGVSVMREISVFRVALITNLEPVYGIILAFIFFGDKNKMNPGFWAGAVIILSTILLYPITHKKIYERKKEKISA